jgi:hypothetical protein
MNDVNILVKFYSKCLKMAQYIQKKEGKLQLERLEFQMNLYHCRIIHPKSTNFNTNRRAEINPGSNLKEWITLEIPQECGCASHEPELQLLENWKYTKKVSLVLPETIYLFHY